MPRPLRIEYPGAYYHVMNHGAHARDIFLSQQQRHLFLRLLADLQQTYHITIHAYCLMDDHYHLLLETPRANLSRAMRHLNGLYTQSFNRLQQTDGSLFRGRYKAMLLDANTYLSQVSRYIHCIPLITHKLDNISDYVWSSYPAYTGEAEAPSWLTTNKVHAQITNKYCNLTYQAFVQAGVDDTLKRFYQTASQASILGDKHFKEALLEHKKTGQLPPALLDAKQTCAIPSLDKIVQAVANNFNVQQNIITQSKRGQLNTARMVAVYLAKKHAGYQHKSIMERISMSSSAAVGATVRRCAQRLTQEKTLQNQVQQLKKQLF